MEEFETFEAELRVLYDDYIKKFRYFAYLEHLYENAAKTEQETKRKQLEKMKAKDVKFESIMEGNDSILILLIFESLLSLANIEKQNSKKIKPSSRLKSASRSSRTQISQHRIYGNLDVREGLFKNQMKLMAR